MRHTRYRLAAQATSVRIVAWGGDEEELLRHAVIGTLALALGHAPRGEAAHWHAVTPWPDDLGARLVLVARDALYRLYLRGEVTVDVRSAPDRGYVGVIPLPPRWSLKVEVQAVACPSICINRSGRLRATLVVGDAGQVAG